MANEMVWSEKDLQIPELVEEVQKLIDTPYEDYVFKRLQDELVMGGIPVPERINRQEAIKFFFENEEARRAVLGIEELPMAKTVNTDLDLDIESEEVEKTQSQIDDIFERLKVYRSLGDSLSKLEKAEDLPELLRNDLDKLNYAGHSEKFEEILELEGREVRAYTTLETKLNKNYIGQCILGGLTAVPPIVALGAQDPAYLFGMILPALGALFGMSDMDNRSTERYLENLHSSSLRFKDKKTGLTKGYNLGLNKEVASKLIWDLQKKHGDGGEFVRLSRGEWDLEFSLDSDKNEIHLHKTPSGGNPFVDKIPYIKKSRTNDVGRNNEYILDATKINLGPSVGFTQLYGRKLNDTLNDTESADTEVKDIVYYAAMAEWASKIEERKEGKIAWPKFKLEGRTKIRGQIHPQLMTKQGWGVPNDYDESSGRLHVTKGPMGNGKSTSILGIGMQYAMGNIGLFNTATSSELIERDNILVMTSNPGSIGEEKSRMMKDAYNGRQLIERLTPNSLVILDDAYIGAPSDEAANALIDLIEASMVPAGVQVLCATHFKEVEDYCENHPMGANYHVIIDSEGAPTYKVGRGVNTASNMDRILSDAGADRQSLMDLAKSRVMVES